MPRMAPAIFAAHKDSVLKLAKREGGVSVPQLVSELNVTAPVARSLVKKTELVEIEQKGRTKYYKAPNGTKAPEPAPAAKPPAKAVVKPESDDPGEEPDLNAQLQELDDYILATRKQLTGHALKAGEALGEWAKHQALVDALRERMTELATKRMQLVS